MPILETLPASAYVSPPLTERTAVFGSTWQLVTHSSRLPAPGATLATTLAGWPILLVRGEDGALRGFHNVCRHRASPLVWNDESPQCTHLVCPYHGWTYGLDGRLLRAPDFGGDPGASGLFPIQTTEVQGLVFVFLGTALPPLPDLSPLAGVPIEDFRFDRLVRHPLACDWKTYAENYLEGHHIPYLHPELAREVNVASYHVHVGAAWVSHAAEVQGEGANGGRWVWLWPNVAVNVYRSGMNLERVLPDGPGRCVVEYTYLFAEGTSVADRDETVAMSHRVTLEDRRMVEAVQRNLAAGVYRTGSLSPKHERGVEAFQRWWTEALSPKRPTPR
ncbi:(2Fe-2S) ferredoxin [Deltaproteobacteria bacterium]|nr:(2Fe-2S) ferredoxin [Deltaproteobacteria bacterium]